MDLDWICARTYSAIFLSWARRSIFLLSSRLLSTTAEKVPVLLCLAQQMTTITTPRMMVMMKCLCADTAVQVLQPFGNLSQRYSRSEECWLACRTGRRDATNVEEANWVTGTWILLIKVSLKIRTRDTTVIAVIGLCVWMQLGVRDL